MKPIGGYFEFEFQEREHYHKNAIMLSTARQCLEYILRAREYKRIYIPYYTCDALLEPITKMNIEYKFYHIDNNLDPIFNKYLDYNEALLYTNYFGLKQTTVISLSKQYKNLIIDNAQAFFAPPLENIDTFYSARKFFGVPDGAYLYTNNVLEKSWPTFIPTSNIQHLLGRITHSAEMYFENFKESELNFSNMEIHKMSIISERILKSLNYQQIIKKRRENYTWLYHKLNGFNKINFNISYTDDAPMMYPLWINKTDLRQKLISYRIFIPQFWKCVQDWTDPSQGPEIELSEKLYPIPIDQRYNIEEMNYIIDHILKL